MHKTRSDRRHEIPDVIATTPASASQRKVALGALVVLLTIAAITLPFANIQLARVDAFVPVIQTVMCVADLLTAVLLYGQYSIYPQHAVLVLASGYVFSGLFAFLQTLAFPGAYAPLGLIGDQNTAAWLFVLWHVTFPLAVIVYALLKDAGEPINPSGQSTGVAIGTAGCVVTATAGLTWALTTFAGYLPSLYTDMVRQVPLANYANVFLSLLCATALLLLFVRRRTMLDHWLIVTLLAWLPNFIVAFSFTVVRFTVGWYVSRVFALCAGSSLLLALLAETIVLYKRLTTAARIGAQQQTELSTAMAALEEVNLWLNTALKNMTHGLSMFDKDQRLILSNERYNEIYGLAHSQTTPGATLRSILKARLALGNSPEDIDAHIEERLRGVRNSQPSYAENKLYDERVVAVSYQPMSGGGWVAVHQDITERRRAEEHKALLLAELDHRVKNILARVAVVAKYTLKDGRPTSELIQALDRRIQSMAEAHTLLSQTHWRGVSLADLARRQLAPYTTETNIGISGPEITLSAAPTQALAMVLQELVTNAVKYGALSALQGKVSVTWDRRDSADGVGRVTIVWRETGGPPTKAPSHSSYGTNLIRNLIPHELGGSVNLEYAPEGLRCDIEIPLKRQRGGN